MGKKRILAALLVGAIALAASALDARLAVREYEINAGLGAPYRIALVTDLHSCSYGKNQQTLIDAVRSLSPDAVLLGGDIFDDGMPNDNAAAFLSVIAAELPCYYVTGNHEYWAGETGFSGMMDILADCGVTVLSGGSTELAPGLVLSGIDDPVRYLNDGDKGGFLRDLTTLASSEALAEESGEVFHILLSHRPEYFADYAALGFELVLCGHAHGGQWRIPGLVNGVYAPNQGILPPYAGGMYTDGGTTMLVSRGLARETTAVPRIWNRPEVVSVVLR